MIRTLAPIRERALMLQQEPARVARPLDGADVAGGRLGRGPGQV
jgi:hypothetical protein